MRHSEIKMSYVYLMLFISTTAFLTNRIVIILKAVDLKIYSFLRFSILLMNRRDLFLYKYFCRQLLLGFVLYTVSFVQYILSKINLYNLCIFRVKRAHILYMEWTANNVRIN